MQKLHNCAIYFITLIDDSERVCTAAAAHVETHPLSLIKGYATVAMMGVVGLAV